VSDIATSRWREQYHRMKRWRTRLNELGKPEEQRRDDVYAFFVCCHHLADWIANDGSLDRCIRNDVRRFMKKTSALGLAADLANGFKHLERNRPPEVDPSAHVSVVGGFYVGAPGPALSGIVVAGDQT
jgi:hypothetical protein